VLSAGLLSFFVGSLAVLFATLPVLQTLLVPLSGLGLVLGLWGLATYRPQRGRRILPLLGTAVSLLGLGYAGVNFVLSGGPRTLSAAPAQTSPRAVVGMGPRAGDAPTPTGETDWVDASREALQMGDVRVRITSVTVGPVEFKSEKQRRFSRERCLAIRFRVRNVGVERRFEYTSWAEPSEPPAATLRDAQGKVYRIRSFGPDVVLGHTAKGLVTPGKFVEDVLVFDPPARDVEFLRLELAATACGGKGKLLLQIPGSMIRPR
jgi:hypothetical protein